MNRLDEAAYVLVQLIVLGMVLLMAFLIALFAIDGFFDIVGDLRVILS